MNANHPFDKEQDPELKVTVGDNGVEVQGVDRLKTVEEFKQKLAQMKPEEIMELLRGIDTPGKAKPTE